MPHDRVKVNGEMKTVMGLMDEDISLTSTLPTNDQRKATSNNTRRRPASADSKSIRSVQHTERKDPNEIEELNDVHDKVLELGFDVRKSTLDRSLLPPTRQPVETCQQEIGREVFTGGLLSSPEKWLKAEYKKLREAQKQVKRCEMRLREDKLKAGC
ncbi:hypothetical protein EB796_005741 [Bugula neritina]|uniref:Uncharacterized protein n=1 Tax=Bugula neritina TaxID=10212 RepID=A0A7J7KBC6_BUGNE|nr:hypothetical protein EB796_005741 [Bugula neritina]